MISIASLLNPTPKTDVCDSSQLLTPSPTPPLASTKMSRNAAASMKAKIKGEVRYAPFEILSAEVKKKMEEFQVFPMTNMEEFCRHIPYNSEKTSFLQKTGRESFEVFAYPFKLPGEEREYYMMWDYNIGLVRITSLFKSCKYSKTTPAKMLNSNPGLRDICHNITGGALAAQGYWMPYEAAKAVAATFCYPIRYALVPLFGEEFLSECMGPDSPKYRQMIISKDIIRRCTEAANELRFGLEKKNSSPETNIVPNATSASTKLSPAFAKLFQRLVRAWERPSAVCSKNSLASGKTVRVQGWPKSVIPPELPSQTILAGESLGKAKRPLSEVDEDCKLNDGDDDEVSLAANSSPETRTSPTRTLAHLTEEEEAAWLIVQLHVEDTALQASHKNKRGRFS